MIQLIQEGTTTCIDSSYSVCYNGIDLSEIWACDTSNATCTKVWNKQLASLSFCKSGCTISNINIQGSLPKDLIISCLYRQSSVGSYMCMPHSFYTYSAGCTCATPSNLTMTYYASCPNAYFIAYGNYITDLNLAELSNGCYCYTLYRPGETTACWYYGTCQVSNVADWYTIDHADNESYIANANKCTVLSINCSWSVIPVGGCEDIYCFNTGCLTAWECSSYTGYNDLIPKNFTSRTWRLACNGNCGNVNMLSIGGVTTACALLSDYDYSTAFAEDDEKLTFTVDCISMSGGLVE